MLSYETAKKLKDAGFPQKGEVGFWRLKNGKILENGVHAFVVLNDVEEQIAKPSLSELIEACGAKFACLEMEFDAPCEGEPVNTFTWEAVSHTGIYVLGTTPEEAVANLYLALHEKNVPGKETSET